MESVEANLVGWLNSPADVWRSVDTKFVIGYVNICVCVQKFPTDKAYFIAKELLTTERTYIKDLQVITEVPNLFLVLLISVTCSGRF